MMSISLSNTATLNIKSFDYHCIVSLISKNEATNLLQNADWTEKWEHYKKKKIFLKVYVKMKKNNYKTWWCWNQKKQKNIDIKSLFQ